MGCPFLLRFVERFFIPSVKEVQLVDSLRLGGRPQGVQSPMSSSGNRNNNIHSTIEFRLLRLLYELFKGHRPQF